MKKLCYKSVVIKNSPSGYFMQTEKRGPVEYFPTVHLLIESERKKQRLNHSIVSKMYRSLIELQKRKSAPSTYHRWTPSAEVPEETPKPTTSATPTNHSSVYSTWNAKALPLDSTPTQTTTPSTGSGGYMVLPEQPKPTTTTTTTLSPPPTISDTHSPYATWQEGDKSKTK